MIMFKILHDGNFALEILKEFTGEFRPDDGFNSNYSGCSLHIESAIIGEGKANGAYHMVPFGDDSKGSLSDLLSDSIHSHLFVEHL